MNAGRLLVCGAFILAAATKSVIPLLLLSVALSVVVIWLPLRRYRVTSRLAVAMVMVVHGSVALAVLVDDSWRQTVLVGLFMTVALVVSAFYAQGSMQGRTNQKVPPAAFSGRDLRAPYMVAASAGPVGALVVISMTLFAFRDTELSDMRWPLLMLAVGGALAALVTATVSGLVEASLGIDRVVVPWIARPRRGMVSGLSSWAQDFESRAFSSRGIRRTVNIVSMRVLQLVGQAISMLIGLVTRATNWAHRVIVLSLRRISLTTTVVGQILIGSTVAGRSAGVRSLRYFAVPTVAMVAGVLAAWTASSSERNYLVSGSAAALGRALCFAALGLVALGLSCVLMARGPLTINLDSMRHTAGIVLSWLVVLQAAAGWAVGAAGMLGYGPIRVGWLTLTATAVVVAVALWNALGRRNSAEMPAGTS